MAGQYVQYAIELDDLGRTIENLEERYDKCVELVFDHIQDLFKDLDHSTFPKHDYFTHLNAEYSKYGTNIADRKNWYDTCCYVKIINNVLGSDSDRDVRIEDDRVFISGTTWYYDGEHDRDFTCFPLAWLDLDREGIEAELAALKEAADSEEKAAAEKIAEIEAAEKAEREKAAEAEERALYEKLKAKYGE